VILNSSKPHGQSLFTNPRFLMNFLILKSATAMANLSIEVQTKVSTDGMVIIY